MAESGLVTAGAVHDERAPFPLGDGAPCDRSLPPVVLGVGVDVDPEGTRRANSILTILNNPHNPQQSLATLNAP